MEVQGEGKYLSWRDVVGCLQSSVGSQTGLWRMEGGGTWEEGGDSDWELRLVTTSLTAWPLM